MSARIRRGTGNPPPVTRAHRRSRPPRPAVASMVRPPSGRGRWAARSRTAGGRHVAVPTSCTRPGRPRTRDAERHRISTRTQYTPEARLTWRPPASARRGRTKPSSPSTSACSSVTSVARAMSVRAEKIRFPTPLRCHASSTRTPTWTLPAGPAKVPNPTQRSPDQHPTVLESARVASWRVWATPSLKPWKRWKSVGLEHRASIVNSSGIFPPPGDGDPGRRPIGIPGRS